MTDKEPSSLPDIRSSDYQDWTPGQDHKIEFKAPVSEADARAWAQSSGFRIVVIKGEGLLETIFTSERIALQANEAGEIVGAEIG